MTSTTYITPEISFRDFSDFNPGHGTDSVAENVQYFRDEYSATRVKRITTSHGIQFAVTGPIADMARLAGLYA